MRLVRASRDDGDSETIEIRDDAPDEPTNQRR